MPSLSFISTIAMALLAISPVMAQTPPRGRPNHADEYGYPHNRGVSGPPRRPMTPGGYVDPRPANPGATCAFNNQCSTDVRNGAAICTAAGTCSFRCIGNTVEQNGACVGQVVAPRCSFNRQCATTVNDATGRCIAGRCSFACNRGFFAQGATCAPAALTCGAQACPDVPGGYSVCVNDTCTARCETQQGFQQFCNADGSVCQCINIQNDLNNCGTPGNVCPPSYNGLGRAYCANGQCGLSCNRLTTVRPTNGPAYCSARR